MRWTLEDEKVDLPPDQASEYRGLAARANYLGLDRPDLQYAAKERMRKMLREVKGISCPPVPHRNCEIQEQLVCKTFERFLLFQNNHAEIYLGHMHILNGNALR